MCPAYLTSSMIWTERANGDYLGEIYHDMCYGGVEGTPNIFSVIRPRRRATQYFFSIMLSHADLVNRPYDAITIVIPYGGLINSPVRHKAVAISYVGQNTSSV